MQFAVLQVELFLFIEAEIKGKAKQHSKELFSAVLMNNECNSTTEKVLEASLSDDGKERQRQNLPSDVIQ